MMLRLAFVIQCILLALAHESNPMTMERAQAQLADQMSSWAHGELQDFYGRHYPDKAAGGNAERAISKYVKSGRLIYLFNDLASVYTEHKDECLRLSSQYRTRNDDLYQRLQRSMAGVRMKWCCATEFDALDNQCDNVFYRGGAWEHHSVDWTFERKAMVWVTSITNFAFFPAIVASFRQDTPTSFIGIATMLTSGLYHAADSVERKVLGMNAGQWHRLDNTFAITSFVNSFLINSYLTRPTLDLWRWGMFLLILCLMEYNPWALGCTLGPIFISVCVFLHALCTKRSLARALWNKESKTALVFLLCAVVCFYKGLEQQLDYLRMWHGGWHLFVGAFAYKILCARALALRTLTADSKVA